MQSNDETMTSKLQRLQVELRSLQERGFSFPGLDTITSKYHDIGLGRYDGIYRPLVEMCLPIERFDNTVSTAVDSYFEIQSIYF